MLRLIALPSGFKWLIATNAMTRLPVVLLIGDATADQIRLQHVLAQAGAPCEIVGVASVDEAIAHILSSRPCLIGVAAQKPLTEIAHLINQVHQSTGARSPIVLCTSDDTDHSIIVRATRLGIDDCLNLDHPLHQSSQQRLQDWLDGSTRGEASIHSLPPLNSSLDQQTLDPTSILKEKASTLQAIVNQATVGILQADAHGRLLEANPKVCELLGYTKAELQAKTFQEITHPDDVEADLQLHRQVLAGKIDSFSLEKRYLHKNGEPIWVHLTVAGIQAESGELGLSVGVIQDIRDRKHAEQQLNEQWLFLKSIIDAIPSCIFVKDLEERFVLVNQAMAQLYNLTVDEMIGTLDHYDPPQSLELFQRTDQQVLSTRQMVKSLELARQLPNGEIRCLQGFKVPLIRDGQVYNILGVLIDITERKQVQDALEHANEQLIAINQELKHATRMKDEFLASMSHELRTPLNAILGLSEGLQDDVYGRLSDRQRKAIATIERSGRHLLELINDILDLAKIEAGKMELQRSAVSVEALCDSSWAFVRQQALQKQIHLTTHIQPDMGVIVVDQRRIRQVLINLLSNAVKFTPAHGQIQLHASSIDTGSQVCFTVVDTGIGIAPDDLDKLFEPFIQIDSRLSRSYSGTGLGLALVRRIVTLHGGQIVVTSQVGQGSQFTITLPQPGGSLADRPETVPPACELPDISVVSRATASRSLNSVNKPLDSHQPLVLLVEDNEANCEVMFNYLNSKQYRIAVARDGFEAIATLQTLHPDLILMDIQMPRMDGLEAIRQIRQMETFVATPIIALTALAMVGDRERCLKAGADAYLTKPISLNQLNMVMQQYLAKA